MAVKARCGLATRQDDRATVGNGTSGNSTNAEASDLGAGEASDVGLDVRNLEDTDIIAGKATVGTTIHQGVPRGSDTKRDTVLAVKVHL